MVIFLVLVQVVEAYVERCSHNPHEYIDYIRVEYHTKQLQYKVLMLLHGSENMQRSHLPIAQ
jgi:hypothetical protein